MSSKSSTPNPKYLVKTLGCKANWHDGQRIERDLSKLGLEEACQGEAPGLVVVNNCTVTNEAERQSQKLAQKLKRQYPNSKVVMTGCGAEVDPSRYEGVADHVVANRDKHRLGDLVLKAMGESEAPLALGQAHHYEDMASRHPMDREWALPANRFIPSEEGGHSRTRGFLKVQEGCNRFCTYCVIPYGRGPSRSLRPQEVLSAVKAWIDQGFREIVLTGTNLGDYGVEWAPKGEALEELVSLILTQTSLERLRVSSLDPVEITPGLVELCSQYEAFCPHFHVSLQSTVSSTLRRMKRNYDGAAVREGLERIASLGPQTYVGMDLIVGFPGESDEDFEALYRDLESLPWSRIHVFPYSERDRTPATKLDGVVPVSVRKERSRRIRELSLRRLEAHYHARQDQKHRVLLEQRVKGPDGRKDWLAGHTPEYLRVLLPPQEGVSLNTVVTVRVACVLTDANSGEVCYLSSNNI